MISPDREHVAARSVGAALRLDGLTKDFGGQRALDEVDLTVSAGEIHALVGHNGSGKSTLVKILAGYHRPGPGAHATVAGIPFRLGSADAARAAGVRFVHQDLGLIDTLTVADNIHLSHPGRRLAPAPRRAERAAARAALAALGYAVEPTAPVGGLAESERTAVAVARALDRSGGPAPLLVLDEPTATLSAPEAARLFDAVRRVAAAGTAVLFVSHHLDEVLDLADTVTVLRDGRRVTTRPAATLRQDDLVELMLGRRMPPGSAAAAAARAGEPPRVVVTGLTGATVRDLDLEIGPGEVVGVAGLTGSGREEVAGLLAGRLPRTGTVTVRGVEVGAARPLAAITAGVGYVPADRAHALLPRFGVRENLTLADLTPFRRGPRLRRDLERRETRHWIDELGIRPAEPDRAVAELSGGNQQKVVLARWLRTAPTVLILDEPTQGVDVGAKADIHRLVDEAAAAGTAVLVCSTDCAELARLAAAVVVLRRGRASIRLTGAEVTGERIEHELLAADEPAA
jgi:ribose transport system ATP-binding protein